ncbi:MAG: tRNA (N6-threonylcarbamoyladenosine(37)-N6)-methyltransferase TrmO [Desulfitobacteriia bacterium]|jgi:tRNA-Thr(GGU) m(6)t(6)A37 methyltransferase TsaA
MSRIEFCPIGYIESNYHHLEGIPRQSVHKPEEKARIRLKEEYVPGLTGLEDFKYIIILFHFHKSDGYQLLVKPKGREGVAACGVFASRSPHRPNALGMSIVRLLGIKGNILEFAGVDMLDGTPVLDIKAYHEGLLPE